MALDFGSGVSRSLSPLERAFSHVIWQKGKPPLDSELNLMGSVELERFRQYVASVMPSGFFMDPTRAFDDYQFDQQWANHFHLGVPRAPVGTLETAETQPVVWANVNGWIIPVAGTSTTGTADLHNVIKLYPPPESDSRIDFLFLEVWSTIVQPNPSTVNKPTASTLWKYGNVKHGGLNVADDIEDPTVGSETTKRVQVQYRLRVYGEGLGLGASVNLAVHPDGLTDPNILGQGAASSPVAGVQWTNMRETLGDPSLWRAGDGDPNNDLGSVDGYTYAIPVCGIFRRASSTYVAVKSSGNPSQNGAFLRTPGAGLLTDPLDAAVPLLTASLGAYLSPDDAKLADFEILVTNVNGSGLEDTALTLTSVFLRIDDEIIGIKSVDLTAGTITIPSAGRGRWGTAAVGHDTSSVIEFFNTRPDGLFADEITATDILDLRRAVNPGDWDYNRLLAHNVAALAKGKLRTAWKESNPGDTEGVVVHEVCDLYAGATTHPNHTDAVDGPDGIRMVWSDAATIQPDVTLLLDHEATRDANGMVGFTNSSFDTNVEWDVGADLKPIGFLNTGGGNAGWFNGSSIHVFIGGSTGDGGARGTFRASGVEDVRFVTPNEYWKSGYPIVDTSGGNQHPVGVRFIGEKQHMAPPGNLTTAELAKVPGPMYPWRETRFERPFLVLGGLLNSSLRYENIAVTNLSTFVDDFGVTRYTLDLTSAGVDFDNAVGGFNNAAGGIFPNDPTEVTTALLRNQRTLFGMLTNDGRDRSGASSEVYLMTFGDAGARNNNGGFRVIGAGTIGYTNISGSTVGMLILEPLSADFSTWDAASGNSLTVDFRSQYHNADDVSSYSSRIADFAIVLTDIGGEAGEGTPWDLATVDTHHLHTTGGAYYAPSKAILSLTMLYHPGRSATTRVPDEIVRVAMRGGTATTIGSYLRRSPSTLDTTFSAIGTATDETYWPHTHVQTWNRLSALGWHAPNALSYGGDVVGFTEQDRESEVFVDRGSKSVFLRPFRNRDMTLKALTWTTELAAECLLGPYEYPVAVPFAKESLQILTGTAGAYGTTGKCMGFQVPREFMPRFGRQDIPYYQLVSGATPTTAGFMPGINHLFTDVTDLTNPVFNIIGGERNAAGTEVNPLFLTTTGIDYANSDGIYGPKAVGAYGARKTTDIDPSLGANAVAVIAALAAVNSSDLGRGLQGIQMPPYMGIARLYGVYEHADYVAKGGTTFASNRYAMESNSAVNLIREDADQQTLFILQNGAKDLTADDDDHTYIIPSNVLDLTRISSYVEGTTVFDDFDYVVECTVFFFAKGFINKSNIVLVRERNGSFGLNSDGDDAEIENVPMCIPSPAGVNDDFYMAYNRTVYQGDPYMTRDGTTRQEADYENRYGRLTPSQSWLLRTAVQQFNSAGEFVPEMENERAFQVLASMDFYTTLGTGKVSGDLYAGTMLDVGHIGSTVEAASRMPLTETAIDWRVDVRAFSEGQKENNNRAVASLEVLSAQSLQDANTNDDAFGVQFTLLDDTVVTLYGAVSTFIATLTGAPNNVPAEDIFTLDETSSHRELVGQYAPIGVINDGALSSATVALTGALVGDGVTVNPDAMVNGASIYGFVPAADQVTIVVQNINPDIPFTTLSDNDSIKAITVTAANLGGLDIPAGDSTATTALAFIGAAVGDTVIVNPPAGLAAGLLITADTVTVVDEVTLRVYNITAAPVAWGADRVCDVAVLKDHARGSIDMSPVNFDVRISQTVGTPTGAATALAATINANTKLKRTVMAFQAGTPKVSIEAVPVGAEGNGVFIGLVRTSFGGTGGTTPFIPIEDTIALTVPTSNGMVVGHNTTGSYLVGGVDVPVNAGNGTSQMALTGMTERLPLGVLVQDNDFLCENPLGDDASAMNAHLASLRPIQTLMPLTTDGEEYTRFLGAPGELVAMADVQIAPYSWAAWTSVSPDGATKKFRLYRGGGAAYVLASERPGGPLDWVTESFPSSSQPVLKGGVLACRAMLVRNFYEEALPADGPAIVSQGDEIQMVVLTYAHIGDGNTVLDGITLDGIISPSGYGEGYAAADRYRCMGRPMFRGNSREVPDPSQVPLAVYPEGERLL